MNLSNCTTCGRKIEEYGYCIVLSNEIVLCPECFHKTEKYKKDREEILRAKMGDEIK